MSRPQAEDGEPKPARQWTNQISLTTLRYLGLDEAAQLSAESDAFLPAKFPERDDTTVDGEILTGDERCGIARQKYSCLSDITGDPGSGDRLQRSKPIRDDTKHPVGV